MPNIRFGDIDFSGDGAYVWGAGQYSAPSRSVDFIEVPGRNGDLLIDNGNYNNTKAYFDVVITGNIEENTNRLKYLLYSQKGYQRLYDSDLKGFYRMASYNSGFEIVSNDGCVVRIEFDCKPFKYDILGEEEIFLRVSGVEYFLENPYFEASRPLIRVIGDGEANVVINNTVIHISNIDDYVIIDTDLQDAYKGDAERGFINKNDTINTADFCLLPGKNIVYFSESVNEVKIAPRWVTV